MSDNAPERLVNDSIHDASMEYETQSEAVEEISAVLQNSHHVVIQKEEVTKVTKSCQENSARVRVHFCKLCEQSFTRAQSLNRHNERKHAKLKDPVSTEVVRPKRARRNTNSKNLEDQNEKSKTVESDTLQSQPKRNTRSLKISLSNKFQVAKTVKGGGNNVGRGDFKAGSSYPMKEEEITAIHALKEACKKLQSVGQQVLVVASNGEHAQWFGSNYGVNFAEDNPDVIGSFFTYCKEKEESWRQEMKITVKSENETVEDKEMGNNENTSDGVAVGSDVGDENDGNDDDDNNNDDDNDGNDNVCDYNNEEEDIDDGNDDKGGKNAFKPVVGKSKQFAENRDKMYKEIAENLSANETSRDASIMVKKKNGVRPVIYTVAQLNRGKYHCTLCGYKFLWKCHLEVHQAKNPYCVQKKDITICENDVLKESITFDNNQTGVEITSTFQELLDLQTVDTISCVVCGRSGFSTRGKLKEHLILHNESNIFECNICNSGFTTISFLSSHLKEHFKKPYECHSCQWRFTTDEKLKQHANGGCRSVSLIYDKGNSDVGLDRISYKCSVCSSEVVGLKNLRKHLETEHNQQFGLNDCILCSKQFSSTGLYNRHMLLHKYQYSCPYCPKTFGEKSNMYFTHVKSHRCLTDYPYVCDICGEKFKSKRYFEPHRRIHTGEKPYVCKEEGCGKAFRSPDGLDQHKWCHINKHFICDFCGRKFKKPSLLNNHLRTHTQEWRYPCIYCELKFRKLRPFKRHLARVHPNKVEDVKERFKIILHPCNECPKVFFDKEDHTAHIYRHKGIKPFSCNICSKKFSDKSNMLSHMKGHHGGKRLKCSMCPRKFNTEKFLQDHVARLHTQKPNEADVNGENDENHDDQDEDDGQRLTIALSDGEEDIDQLRESTLQIIDETIRGNVSFE